MKFFRNLEKFKFLNFRLHILFPVLLVSLPTTETASADLIAGTAEFKDEFGWSQATGDFNGDGQMDLAVGVPFEDVFGYTGFNQDDVGVANIFYGYYLDANDHIITNYQPGVSGSVENSFFGWAVASADFNNDGLDDLAVGLPGFPTLGQKDAGAIHIFYGAANGLYGNNVFFWPGYQSNEISIKGVPEAGDRWGGVLATGDFNNDGYYDLAIGAPGEDIESANAVDAGAVSILYGSDSGLTVSNNQLWSQKSDYIEGHPETGDGFGWSLTSGDFNGDGRDDLAIGVASEDISSVNAVNAGAVNVLYGGNGGLSANNNQIWHQESDSIQGTSEDNDSFGWALATGDFNNDGRDDLAVGVMGENYGEGIVNIIYGGDAGLSANGNRYWGQGSDNIEGQPELGDHYGFSLAAGYFNNDNYADLAIGVPQEAVGEQYGAHGAVNVMFGSASGLAANGDQLWTNDSDGIPGNPGVGAIDEFGRSLAAGDFNGDGIDELSVGLPGRFIYGIYRAGAVRIFTGGDNGLTGSYAYLFQD